MLIQVRLTKAISNVVLFFQIPYNMERLWYIFSNGDTKLVSTLMEKFEKTGSVSVPKELSTKVYYFWLCVLKEHEESNITYLICIQINELDHEILRLITQAN